MISDNYSKCLKVKVHKCISYKFRFFSTGFAKEGVIRKAWLFFEYVESKLYKYFETTSKKSIIIEKVPFFNLQNLLLLK